MAVVSDTSVSHEMTLPCSVLYHNGHSGDPPRMVPIIPCTILGG